MRSLAYKAEELGFAEVIPQENWTVFFVKRTVFSKRHPVWFASILLAIGVIFSVIAGTVNAFISEQIKAKCPKIEFKKTEATQSNEDLIYTNSQKEKVSKTDTLQTDSTKISRPD